LLEFTTRQIVITRVYHPALWRVGLAGHLVFNAAFWLLPFGQPTLWAAVYVLSMARSWIRYQSVKTVLPTSAISKFGWFYVLGSPLVALLYLYNMAASMWSREILWRGIRYRLVSPTETRVYAAERAGKQ
jgi:hypothetical protein